MGIPHFYCTFLYIRNNLGGKLVGDCTQRVDGDCHSQSKASDSI